MDKDTTGAGVTFYEVLALLLTEDKSIEEAIIAGKGASLFVTKFGTQAGMPAVDEISNFMNK